MWLLWRGGLAANHTQPRKEIPLYRVRNIRWSGMNIVTPMETFRLRAPNGASHLALSPSLIFSYKSEKSLCGAVGPRKAEKEGQTLEENISAQSQAERCTELFRSMKEFHDVKQTYEGERPHMDTVYFSTLTVSFSQSPSHTNLLPCFLND